MKLRRLVLPALSVVCALPAAENFSVRVGQTVEITRSHYYCWFPTVHQYPSGEIMVAMSMCPDQKHPEGNFSAYCISRDGGRTWSPRHTMGQQANQDGAWSEVAEPDGTFWQWGSYPEPVRDGDAYDFFASLTKFGRAGRTVMEDRDVTLRMAHPVYLAPTNLYAYGGAQDGLLVHDTQLQGQYNLRAWGNIIRGWGGELFSTVYYLTAEDNVRYQPHPRDHFRIVLVRSDDGGHSWSEVSTIAVLPDGPHPPWFGIGPTEGSLALLEDGRLYAVFRTGGPGSTIGECWSADGGRSWSRPASIGFEGVAPRLHRMRNGMLILVTGRPGPVVLHFNPDEEGRRWTHPVTIFTGMSTRYTDVAEIAPGRLLVVYDSVPYGWHEIPYSDREARNRVLGTFVDVVKGAEDDDEGPGAPQGLMCDLLAEPRLTVISSPKPRFSWMVNDHSRGAIQTAYQILVSSRADLLAQDRADVWDSGMVPSGQSTAVEYGGPPLAPGRSYFWKVRTWAGGKLDGPYSQAQEFRTAPAGKPSAWAERYPLEKTEIAPVRLVAKGPGDYFVDFGRAAFGTVTVRLTSPAPGSLEVRLGEVPQGVDGINPNPGGARRYRVMTVPLQAGARTYRVAVTPGERNTTGAAIRMPPEVGEVMPFRYCELVGVPGELGADQIRQIAVHYPFDDGAASFDSSDRVLNDVWKLCHYSIKATSFSGTYVDGDRERIPYEADAYIDQLGHYSSDREYSLARHSEQHLLDHATWPAEWQMHMPMVVWNDYLYTGDDRLLSARYDELAAKTLVALERADGLVDDPERRATPELLRQLHLSTKPAPPLRHPNPAEVLDLKHPVSPPLATLTDWPPWESDGYEMKPVSIVTNAFHYIALRRMAEIASALDRPEEARRWRERAGRVRHAFQAVFFDPARGLYVDGEGTRHASIHGNMFALAFGLVPPEHLGPVLAFIKSKGMACSVYGAQYLFEALYRAGAGDYALQLMTARGDRSWPHMIYDVGTTITLEAWDDKYKPNEDWNHAWGAAPANLIARQLMGIEPIAPGFARFRVRPQTGSLRRADLTLPTIRGPIRLEVTQPDAGTWRAALTVPANSVAELEVPAGDPAEVSEGGRPAEKSPGVKLLGNSAGRLRFEVPAGSYDFIVKKHVPIS